MEKDEKYWAEEFEKCKDPVYFYENYCLINGSKPPPLTELEKIFLREYPKTDTLRKILFKRK